MELINYTLERKKINKLEGTATETILNEIYREKRLKTLT